MSNPQQAGLSPEIRDLLSRLRRRIRIYVWIEGIAATLALLGGAFWLGLALDWLLEPSPDVRLVVLSLVACAAAVVFYRYVLARAFVRLADTSMAVLVEKYFAQFRDSLLTSVELASGANRESSFNTEMLKETSRDAQDKVRNVQLSAVFNPGPLVRNVTLAVTMCLSVILFGVFASGTFSFYIDRISGSEELWPRRTKLTLEGFPENEEGVRVVKIARGTGYDVVVKADNTLKDPPPEWVQLRYRLMDGSRGRIEMTRIGEAVVGRDDFQAYTYSFHDVFDTHTFDVVGGDAKIRDVRLEVVESPEILDMRIQCEYPKYMGQLPRTLNVTGAMSVPLGTKIVLKAKTNKDLVLVKVLEADVSQPVVINVSGEDRKQFSYTIDALDRDRELLFTLHDTDGIETREPVRVSFAALLDEPPQVTAQLKGIGKAITPQASIPVIGNATDDYGIDRIWFANKIDETEGQDIAFSPAADGQIELPIKQVLEVKPLNLQPEQKFGFTVKAVDRHDLGAGPNVGNGASYILDVVTPDELRTMLESRELQLRQRFETIHKEMEETRDLMARIDFNKVDESVDEDMETDDSTPEERALSRRKLRMVRALQSVQRSGHETLAVATAFEEVREELVNNKIDTEELKDRLQNRIVTPLKNIGGPMIADLEKLILDLETKANNLEAGPEALKATVAQADAVVAEMEAVLNQMMQLESYNEVMDVLRKIVQDQEIINEKTRQQRKENLKSDLLND